MEILFALIMAIIMLGFGLAVGMGNHGGFKGAFLPGLIGGLVLSIPSLKTGDWIVTAVSIAACLAGSLLAVLVPQTSTFKQFAREQTGLVIRMGSYRLGTDNSKNKS